MKIRIKIDSLYDVSYIIKNDFNGSIRMFNFWKGQKKFSFCRLDEHDVLQLIIDCVDDGETIITKIEDLK